MVRIQSKCVYRGGEKQKLLPNVAWPVNYTIDHLLKLQDLYIQIDVEAPFIILSPHVCLFGFNGDLTNIDNHFSDERNLLCDW